MAADRLHIEGLRVATWIGVPEDERTQPQSLAINLDLTPVRSLAGKRDALESTVDYDAVVEQVREIALGQKRRLIETLAEDIANGLLRAHALCEVEVEVRKFILSHCDYVSVRLARSRSD